MGYAGLTWWVAQTQKNAIVCYGVYRYGFLSESENPQYGEETGPAGPPVMEVYDSFEAFQNAVVQYDPSPETEDTQSHVQQAPERLYPTNLVAAVADALKVPYEIELDI